MLIFVPRYPRAFTVAAPAQMAWLEDPPLYLHIACCFIYLFI